MDTIDNKILSIKYPPGQGTANGTFGELLQGVLPNKKNFMVTFPINLFSYATFIPKINTNQITVFPEYKVKSLCLAENLVRFFNIAVGGELIIKTQLPEGKGLASSSADLVATAHAVSNALKININEELIARLIRPIEPSDGVMYPGIVSFYYKELKLIESIGSISNLIIIGLDEGGVIDTLEYNSIQKFYSNTESIKYENMLLCISKAIKTKNLSIIGKIATESSIMNQKYNPKKYLKDLIQICEEINGIGISVAHSGTFIGVLLDSNSANFNFQKTTCLKKIKKIKHDVSIFYALNYDKS